VTLLLFRATIVWLLAGYEPAEWSIVIGKMLLCRTDPELALLCCFARLN